MRTFVLIAALALAGATGAVAAKPTHPTTPASTNANSHANASTTATNASANANASSKSKTPKVMYVLRGTLSKYTAANGAVNGSISITVKSSNFDSDPSFKTTTLKFAVSSSTKIVLHDGKPIADNDKGIVKVRATKHSTAATLQTLTAFQVIDQGAST
jgi:hypothetical protein